MSFVPLHVTSCYDFLNSAIKFDSLFSKLKDYKYSSCGIADLNTMFGYARFAQLASANKIKPIYGLDVVVNNNNLTLFAINENGYKNLIKISYEKSLNNQDSQLNIEDLQRFSSNIVAVISTRYSQIFATKDEDQIAKDLRIFDKIFGSNLYIGLESYSNLILSDDEISTIKRVRHFIEKYPYQLVAFPHIKYLNAEDVSKYDILQAIKNQTTLVEETLEPKGENYLKNPAELHFSYSNEELEATNLIAEKCNFTFGNKNGKLLKFDHNIDSKSKLKEDALKGLKELGLSEKKEYIERLNYELEVIDEMGYNDYFLIVAEYVNYAKNNNILVGPARGSAAGSLVSYCLNITEIDPLEYNLLFERFLNRERVSMPDIDVDFEDTKRNLVVNHLKEKYGSEKVSNICTVANSKVRGALRDIGRVFAKNEDDIDILCNLLIDPKKDFNESYKTIQSFREKVESDKYYFDLVQLANKILKYPRQRGIHAAGVVLNDEPLLNNIPLVYDTSINGNITQIEAEYLEKMGYLKMDILGLTNLSTIHLILDLIEKNKGIKLNFRDIPVEDPSIYPLLNAGFTMGIFQLESEGMNSAIQRVKPTSINDVISILALFRPGPMGNIDTYANRKNNKEKVTYLSPELEEILSETYGIMIYQEQVMQIAQKMAGFSLGKADILRRAISKKKASIMDKMKQEFISGCISKGYSKNVAESTYDLIEKFAQYGFNKSHSVAYAFITNKMAYLKAKYPFEFYIGVLAGIAGSSDSKFIKYINEIKQRKINIELPNINKSSYIFTIDNNKSMIMPFTIIKGLNNKTTDSIIKERMQNGEYKDIFDFILRTYDYRIGQEQIEKLIKSGCFDSFVSNREAILVKLPLLFQKASLIIKSKGQSSLFNDPIKFDLNVKEDKFDKAINELELVGLMISCNPINEISKINNLNYDATIQNYEHNKYHDLVGILNGIKTISTRKTKKQMAYLSIMDANGDAISVTLFPEKYDRFAEILKKKSIYYFTGSMKSRNGKNEFYADEVKKLEVKKNEETGNN